MGLDTRRALENSIFKIFFVCFRIQKMFDILREQSELLKEIRPKILENSGKKEEKKEEASLISKSLFGMTEKFGFS